MTSPTHPKVAKPAVVTVDGITYTPEELAALVKSAKAAQAEKAARAAAESVGFDGCALSADGASHVVFTLTGRMLRQGTHYVSKDPKTPDRERTSLTGSGGLKGYLALDGKVYTAVLTVKDYSGKDAPGDLMASL
jgi:hypothetical protein